MTACVRLASVVNTFASFPEPLGYVSLQDMKRKRVKSAYGLTDVILRIQSFIRLAIGRFDPWPYVQAHPYFCLEYKRTLF